MWPVSDEEWERLNFPERFPSDSPKPPPVEETTE
jgi:hypothetical protein